MASYREEQRQAENEQFAPLVETPAVIEAGAVDVNLRETVAWALDIKFTWDNLGKRMTRKDAGSSARWQLWQYAKKEPSKFIGELAPRAMSILDKHLDRQGDDTAIVNAERKGIKELQGILSAAIAEASGALG